MGTMSGVSIVSLRGEDFCRVCTSENIFAALNLGKPSIAFELNDYVLELASNDGYLLKYFKHFGITVLGVEPARDITSQAIASGLRTILDFFGTKLAQLIPNTHGQPRPIVANNVLAHDSDIQVSVRGLSTLVGGNTLISTENSKPRNLSDGNQFDTIYHEHFSYFSCESIEYLAEKNELSLFDLNVLSVHGGSNRYWITKKTSYAKKGTGLLEEMDYETNSLLSSPVTWKSKSQRTGIYLQNFRDFVSSKLHKGEYIYGYGAAAKASGLGKTQIWQVIPELSLVELN